jgi:hypothetical protein
MNEIGNYNMIETIVLQILKMLSIKLFTHEFIAQLLHTKSPWKLKKETTKGKILIHLSPL